MSVTQLPGSMESSMPTTVQQATDAQRCVVLLGTSKETMGGIASVIVTYDRAGLFERWPVVHIATHSDGSAWQKLRTMLRAHRQYVSLLLRGRVALVHVHSASNASFYRKLSFMLPAFALRVPVIFHLHGGGFMTFYGRRFGVIRRYLIRLVLKQAAAVVVLSAEWRRRLSQLTANRELSAIANPVEAQALLERGSAPATSNTILFIGRLVDEKGIVELVEAYARVRAKHPSWRLCFAGTGEHGELIRQRARELGVLEGLDFLGWIGGEAKLQALREAAIYALPSWIEGLPMGVLEAMAAGLPVVATRIGGIPDLITSGDNGILIEPRDVDALTQALLQLVEEPERRVRMGKLSRERVEAEFTPQQILPQIEALYTKFGVKPRLLERQ